MWVMQMQVDARNTAASSEKEEMGGRNAG